MAEQYGYNLAHLNVELAAKLDSVENEKGQRANAEIERLTSRMEDMTKLSRMLNGKWNDDAVNIEFIDRGQRELIDRVQQSLQYDYQAHERDITDPLLRYFQSGTYSFKRDELKNFMEMLDQHVQGPMQRDISRKIENLLLDKREQTEVMAMFTKALNDMFREIQAILRNMKPQ